MKTVELTESEWLNIRLALLTRANQMLREDGDSPLINKYREIEDKIDRQTTRFHKSATNQQ